MTSTGKLQYTQLPGECMHCLWLHQSSKFTYECRVFSQFHSEFRFTPCQARITTTAELLDLADSIKKYAQNH